MIGQLQAQFHRMESQHAVEHTTAREIKNGISELLDWVVLYVNSMMRWLFKAAYSHIRNRTAPLSCFGMCQMISQEAYFLQVSNYIYKESAFVDSIFPGDDDVHVSAGSFPPPIWTAHFNIVQLKRWYYFLYHTFHIREHSCYLLACYLSLKLWVILQAYLLICRQEISVPMQVSDGTCARIEEFLRFARTNTPNIAELTTDNGPLWFLKCL
jgi:hypothetical protein